MVVEADGRLLGYGHMAEAYWSQLDGHYLTDFITHPDALGQGAASLFHDHMLATLQARGNLYHLTAQTREDYSQAIQFLTERGFKQVMRFPVSHLDVPAFAAKPYLAKLAAVQAAGVEIVSLAQLQERDAQWKVKTHAIIAAALKDLPSPDELTEFTFDQFERALSSPNFLPEGVFLAMDADQVVAISELWGSQANPQKLYTGLTGVLRAYRRRGVATAVKVHAIQFAQSYGATIIETDNEENNPMYQLNLQLDFRPQPAIVEFKKEIIG